jgi:hypothetical protein
MNANLKGGFEAMKKQEDDFETIEEIKKRYGFAENQLVSLEEAQGLYATEDVELSAPLTFREERLGTVLTFRLSIYKGQKKDGDFTGQNGLQLNIERNGEDIAFTFLDCSLDGGWTIDNISETFGIPKDADVWEINEVG